jgi:hypothetical protein
MVSPNPTVPNAGLLSFPTRLATLNWYLALSTGTAAEATSDTTLENEITTSGLARALATASYEANYKLLLVKTFGPATAQKVVSKVGAFDALAGGNLCGESLISPTATVDVGDTATAGMRFPFGR